MKPVYLLFLLGCSVALCQLASADEKEPAPKKPVVKELETQERLDNYEVQELHKKRRGSTVKTQDLPVTKKLDKASP